MKRTIGAAAVIALLASGAAANAGGSCSAGSRVRHVFEAADADGDGLLSEAEYDGAGLAQFGASFAESDLDADGATSLAEYLELYRRFHPSPDEREV